ncbi:MAG: D-alanyl-D-alanine carboxypeptidase family protein [Thermoanaerobacterales bacterium]|nr:D-alanyl-D-alanine carboxypeptidase family protein [Bacillota bacterium]MDI6906332.1 D-alanyl-D-alanine carboxypeptidase family protein [Thermoanaerobacterales bacterium]
MRRRLLALVLTAILVFTLAPAASAEKVITPGKAPLETKAASALLMDAVTGQVLFSKEPNRRQPIASVTKIMTLLLSAEALEKGKVRLEDMVEASEHASGMGGSQIFLAPQEQFTFREMLISIATASANDASVAVAEHLAGSEEAFVQQMNEKVHALGLTNTHYVNTTGLPDEGQYSSAYDQAVILREALRHPIIREVSRLKEYDLRGGKFKCWNTNKLLWWYRGADAGKTGWTNEAQFCLASSARRDNLRLIAVVLGCPEPKSHFQESMKLFNWGFARYQGLLLAKEGQKIKTVPVEKGTAPSVDLAVANEAAVVVPKGETKGIGSRIEIPVRLTAPVRKGQKVGDYVLTKDGHELRRVPIVATRSVPRATFIQQWWKISRHILG